MVAQWEYPDQMVFLVVVIQRIKKIYRTRCSALIKTAKENILIDTSPDLRQQLLNQKIKVINKVFYSHMHADQTHGINDLRPFFINNKKQIPKFLLTYQLLYILKKILNIVLLVNNKEYPSTLKLNKIKNKHHISKITKKI